MQQSPPLSFAARPPRALALPVSALVQRDALLRELDAIERRAREALRDMHTGAATSGASALYKISRQAGDAARHARAERGAIAAAVREAC